jgi:hypothetical protein
VTNFMKISHLLSNNIDVFRWIKEWTEKWVHSSLLEFWKNTFKNLLTADCILQVPPLFTPKFFKCGCYLRTYALK